MDAARRSDSRVLMIDGLFAVLLGIGILLVSQLAALGQVPPRHPLDLLGHALILLAAGAVAVRRVWPLITLALAVGSIAVYLALEYPYGPIFLTGFVASYTVAVRLPTLQSLTACALALLTVLVGHLAELSWQRLPIEGPAMALGAVAFVGIPWGIGAVMRLYRDAEARKREEQARRRAYDERLRVVQEVHDVVGHGLSAINLQSGIALHVLDKRPDQARPALEAIRQTSKDALDELRGTLAVFRRQDDSQGRGPAPGLAQLNVLVERMRQAGLEVEMTVTATPEEIPAAIDLAGYRIIQEALTNVLRHAGPATAQVRVNQGPGTVEVEITDTGNARMADEKTPSAAAETGGHGILGMRERAAAVGGTLESGPRPEGGFQVWAMLPFGKAPEE